MLTVKVGLVLKCDKCPATITAENSGTPDQVVRHGEKRLVLGSFVVKVPEGWHQGLDGRTTLCPTHAPVVAMTAK